MSNDDLEKAVRSISKKGTDLRMLSVVHGEAERHGLYVCSRDGVELLRHPEIDAYVVQLAAPLYARVTIDYALDQQIRSEAGEELVRTLIASAAHDFKIMLYKKAKAYVEEHAKAHL
jgi:hypothetical protein